MNLYICVGRFCKDPEVRYSTDNKAVANFSIAVDRRFKREGQPEADFFNCVAFGKTAEFIEKYLSKGSKVVIEGTLQNNNYEKDGVKHYSDQIIVNGIEFADSKRSGEGNTATNDQSSEGGFMPLSTGMDDDMPFM